MLVAAMALCYGEINNFTLLVVVVRFLKKLESRAFIPRLRL